MKRTILVLVLVGFLCQISPASDIKEGIFDNSSTVEINILTDTDQLWNNRVDPEYQSAFVSITSDSWRVEGKTEVRLAGNSRREICELPPLKIKLKKLDQPWSDPLGKIKVVLSCGTTDDSNDQVVKEYLAYKLYNIISPDSYMVRLAKVTISNLEGKIQDQVMGFILEPDSHIEKRVDIEEMKKKNVNTAQLVTVFYRERDELTTSSLNKVSLFQFMIGNTDWNAHTRQNVKIFEKEGSLIPIPYDFDLAGMVNTSYAQPQQEVPIDNVTQRFYQGYCLTSKDLTETIALFNDNQEKILSLIEEAPLSSSHSGRCIGYLKQFFKTINNPKKLDRYLARNCEIYGSMTAIPAAQ